jgi:4'-phosphopantetheinyl transferase EntD
MSTKQFIKDHQPDHITVTGRQTLYPEEHVIWLMETFASKQCEYPLFEFKSDIKLIENSVNSEANSTNNGDRARYRTLIRVRKIARDILNQLEIEVVK